MRTTNKSAGTAVRGHAGPQIPCIIHPNLSFQNAKSQVSRNTDTGVRKDNFQNNFINTEIFALSFHIKDAALKGISVFVFIDSFPKVVFFQSILS